MASLRVWNSLNNSAKEALELHEGRYAADFGGLGIEQSVEPDTVFEAAEALVNAGIEVKAASQAKVIVLAQEHEVAFDDWAPLRMI